MDKHWKIMEPKRPSLCISVIGGAKSFKLDNKMRETFNTGLIKVGYTDPHKMSLLKLFQRQVTKNCILLQHQVILAL